MCGITGVVDFQQPSLVVQYLQQMNDVAVHRGPDDSGFIYFSDDNAVKVMTDQQSAAQQVCPIGVAMRRLAIVDLSEAGHQPMTDESGRYWIVYNGEVYNFIELRQELEQLGRAFRSRTDTEVVLQAFIEWGPTCLLKFNGMWALVIYDRQTRQIFCARDRFGVKPFHFAHQPGRFAFSSEIKQLLELPWVSRQANRQRLADFFLWGFENHTNETCFQHVHCLPASHYMVLTYDDIQRGNYEPKRYWQPNAVERLPDADAIEKFRDLLADAVQLRLRSDVPVGVTLSGGLDSSSIACLAGDSRQKLGVTSPLDAFNVDFGTAGYSEREFAAAAANRAHARLVTLRPDQTDLLRDWDKFIWHMECPFGGLSYFSNFQIYRLIRSSGISVVLSGQGADELLLGYERYRVYDMLFKFRSKRIVAAVQQIMQARRSANLRLSTQIGHTLYFSIPKLRSFRRQLAMRRFMQPKFYADFRNQTEHVRAATVHPSRESLQISEYYHYKLPHLLHHEDCVSMAHSVETRLPFVDYRLLEFVLGHPLDLLFRDGWSKYILRQAMRGVLPDVVRSRTDKMGYETPTGNLIRQNSDLFRPMLARHRDDPIICIPAIEARFAKPNLDEGTLCRTVSYLSWKEAFGVAI
ncbi:MAG: asparagine synthase (glutamine-hydrolyzing) [Pirellulaceae bacterium]|nr:asparagine synthase (glutamine-hydrolyzing) [Pirellulaceae bacterium]